MLNRVRGEQAALLGQGLEANGSRPFDPERSWERCFDVAIAGQPRLQYWAGAVTLKCIILFSSSTSPPHYLHGDAEIAGSTAQHMATRYMNDDDAVPHHHVGGKGTGDRIVRLHAAITLTQSSNKRSSRRRRTRVAGALVLTTARVPHSATSTRMALAWG